MAGQNDDNMTIRPNHSKPHGNGVGETNEESMNCERNETGDAKGNTRLAGRKWKTI